MSLSGSWDAPSSLPNAVADWIAAGIIGGRWSAGDRLREIEVSEQLGVSRAPVREAIRILHAKGLVKHQPRIGAVVMDFSVETVMDVYEMRAVIESWIYRSSVPALEDDDLERLRGVLAEMAQLRTPESYDRFFELGWTFRQTLHSGSTNGVALELVDQLRARLHSLPQLLRDDAGHVEDTFVSYTRMLEAAERGDGDAAGDEVASFMRAVGAYVCGRYTEAAQLYTTTVKRGVQ